MHLELDAAFDLALRHCWHPVCSLTELAAAAPHPLAVRLLDIPLAVVVLGDGDARTVAVLPDRCPHRSTRLSLGRVEGATLRCANHGWCFDARGRCVDVPSMPGAPVPERAHLDRPEVDLAHGLVWVRLLPGAGTTVPAHRALATAAARVLPGAPYTWPTSAGRRVENFVDLAHFPWVHDGTLGRHDEPVPPVPEVRRVGRELRFDFEPPAMDAAEEALFGGSSYRMTMPLTVDIEFRLASGAKRWLWMTASPIDASTCRTFWTVARDDDLDGDDDAHLAFQDVILREDEPVVCGQDPRELPLDATEVSVRTDRVSIEYRRWLRDLAAAGATDDPAPAIAAALQGTTGVGAGAPRQKAVVGS